MRSMTRSYVKIPPGVSFFHDENLYLPRNQGKRAMEKNTVDASPAGNTIVSVRNVGKQYQLGTVRIDALRGVSVDIRKGEFITIQGPSGCGKTTLLNMIGLIDEPSSGDIIIDGKNAKLLTQDEKAFIRTEIPLIFQFYNLIEYLTALDNVAIALAAKNVRDDKQRKAMARSMLERVGLSNRLQNKPEELSGGERQRVAIARAMVVRPKIILADEPTGDLDTRTGGDILALFQQLNMEYGYTFVIVTHDPKVAAMGKRKILMEDYRIKEDSGG